MPDPRLPSLPDQALLADLADLLGLRPDPALRDRPLHAMKGVWFRAMLDPQDQEVNFPHSLDDSLLGWLLLDWLARQTTPLGAPRYTWSLKPSFAQPATLTLTLSMDAPLPYPDTLYVIRTFPFDQFSRNVAAAFQEALPVLQSTPTQETT